MSHDDVSRAGASPPPASARLLVTAELPIDVHAWADGLRNRFYPPERKRLGAHVTLFHGLPGSAEGEVRRLLGRFAGARAPEAWLVGLMDLESGTALALDSPGIVALHADLGERLHGLIQQKDSHPLRPHITVQNRVSPAEARALQAVLAADLPDLRFRFRGLALSHWRDDLWQMAQLYPFRGQR